MRPQRCVRGRVGTMSSRGGVPSRVLRVATRPWQHLTAISIVPYIPDRDRMTALIEDSQCPDLSHNRRDEVQLPGFSLWENSRHCPAVGRAIHLPWQRCQDLLSI